MRLLTAIALGCLLGSGACFAHEDRIIPIAKDGSLSGIPTEYGPGTLHVDFAPPKAGGARINGVDLTLGKNQVHLPLCVTGLLQTRSSKEIKASASWYHDESVLPFYLHVDFFDPGYDEARWANSGYSFLFNLRTGKLIEMKVAIARDNGRSIQGVPVDVTALCNPDEISAFSGVTT